MLRGLVGEGLRAGVDPQIAQPTPLRNRAEPLAAARLGNRGERGEIDVGGQVRLARVHERIDFQVIAHRLQSRSVAQCIVAVIDEQRSPALFDQPPGDFIDGRRRAGAGFDDRAGFGTAPRFWHRSIHRLAAGNADEAVAMGHHHPFAPAVIGLDQLPHRQGIEELVGDQQDRAVHRHAGQIMMPLRAGNCRKLDILEFG